ncbi:MAG: AbrB/MazE/SpoVT family DNA-binding domain-containing protein [Candidatus Rokubacteria bacterium]|nr:AbrB/MazE/SpoVT family DNA-binding domain-containing protein [Candidatus Rokubacteria bacterium]
MRITSKGQVTIPLAIRRKAGLLPATEVEFRLRGSTVILRRVRAASHRGGRLLAGMRGRATTRLTTDQIMALTRAR